MMAHHRILILYTFWPIVQNVYTFAKRDNGLPLIVRFFERSIAQSVSAPAQRIMVSIRMIEYNTSTAMGSEISVLCPFHGPQAHSSLKILGSEASPAERMSCGTISAGTRRAAVGGTLTATVRPSEIQRPCSMHSLLRQKSGLRISLKSALRIQTKKRPDMPYQGMDLSTTSVMNQSATRCNNWRALAS